MSAVFYFGILSLIAAQCNGSVLQNRQSEDNNEENLVVEELVNIIRNKQQKLDNLNDEYEAEDENYNAEKVKADPSFTYQSPKVITGNDVPENEKTPFAVPPSDYRFYEKHFLAPETIEQNNEEPKTDDSYDKIKIISPIDKEKKSPTKEDMKKESENSSANEEDNTHRRQMFSFFLLAPPPDLSKNENFVKSIKSKYLNSTNVLAVTYGIVCGLLVISIIGANIIYRNLRKKIKDAEEVDYPAYGVTGPNKDKVAPTDDKNLAHSAQMYHYQHQKQQIVAMEKSPTPTIIRKGTESGSEEDDFTVYECPGLAPVTGEMEVKNPMFQDEENMKSWNVSEEEKQKKINSDTKKTNKK
ncbi:hypothetical protein PGB90_001338 [Kerria lacca]